MQSSSTNAKSKSVIEQFLWNHPYTRLDSPYSYIVYFFVNEPLFCLVAICCIHKAKQKFIVCLCSGSQGNKGTSHKGTAYGYRALKVNEQ